MPLLPISKGSNFFQLSCLIPSLKFIRIGEVKEVEGLECRYGGLSQLLISHVTFL